MDDCSGTEYYRFPGMESVNHWFIHWHVNDLDPVKVIKAMTSCVRRKLIQFFIVFFRWMNGINNYFMTGWKFVGQCIQDVIEANVMSLNFSIISEFVENVTRSDPTSSWQ